MPTQESRIVFAGKNDLRNEPFEVPDVLEPDQVVVRNVVSLLSQGTELAVLRRTHRAFSYPKEVETGFKYPYYPGYASVGHVEAVGSAVTDFRVGDRVQHTSGHATVSIVRADRCLLVPEGVASNDAVFYNLVKIAMSAIRRAPAELGESVVVSGFGLVGTLVAKLYQLSGASVAVSDMSAGRLERGKSLGFETRIDLSQATLPEWYRAHPEVPAPDMAVEASGFEAGIDACLKAVREGGRVVLQGSYRNTMEIDPYTDIHRKGLTVIATHVTTVSDEVRRRDVPIIFALCNGPLELNKLRTHELPYTEAAALYDRLEDSRDDYLAVLLTY